MLFNFELRFEKIMATIEKRKDQDGKIRYQVRIRLKGYPTQVATFLVQKRQLC